MNNKLNKTYNIVDNIIKDENGCKNWVKCKSKAGYGQVRINNVTYYVQRLIFERYNYKIDRNIYICHHCDNPGCVEIEHLFAGTAKDNAQDMSKKQRSPIGERQGRHKLTEKQVLEIREKYSTGLFLFKDLAEEYGVIGQTISNIVNRKQWKHI